MRKHLIKTGAVLTIVAASAASAYLAVLVSDREPPTRYYSGLAVPPLARRGGTLEIRFQIDRINVCETRGERWLIDSEGTRHSIPNFTVGDTLEMGLQTIVREIEVPELAAPGPASYYAEVEYVCNFVHRLGFPLTQTTPHVPFTISESEPIAQIPEACPDDRPVAVKGYCRRQPTSVDVEGNRLTLPRLDPLQ